MKKIVIMGDADEATIQQAEHCLVEAEAVLPMADNHGGYGMPVGGVAVYKDRIPPAGVGFDIGCGNKAVRTNLKLGELEDRLEPLADEIFSTLAFGVGQGNKTRAEHELFEDPVWKESVFLKRSGKVKATAQAQLGSIGVGNHFVDVKEKLAKKGVVPRGASADEAPEVYKDLQEVLAAHEGTIEILHTLRPLIVCMAE